MCDGKSNKELIVCGGAQAHLVRPFCLQERPIAQIAVSGGIGSGKSQVAAVLSQRGAYGIDADRIARSIVDRGTEGLRSLVEYFGSTILREDASLDRKRLGSVIFADPQARHTVESITHPLIWQEAKRLMALASAEGRVSVYDIPLLVESGMADYFDVVIIVDAPKEIREERLISRGEGMSSEDIQARMQAQVEASMRYNVANIWIDNLGTRKDLDDLVNRIIDCWMPGTF